MGTAQEVLNEIILSFFTEEDSRVKFMHTADVPEVEQEAVEDDGSIPYCHIVTLSHGFHL